MHRWWRAGAGAGTLSVVLLLPGAGLAATPVSPGPIELPAPGAARAQELALVCNSAVGGTPERCKHSSVPGPVVNDEVVLVGVDGSGAPTTVQLEQRLLLSGVGDYVVRERGPARSAVGLIADSDPPSTKLGAVVFEGFSPGRRQLGARLTLDTGLEAPRLPLGVGLRVVAATAAPPVASPGSPADTGQGPRPLGPGGTFPGAARLQLQLTNQTAQPADLPTGGDADPALLAAPLDLALRAARAPAGPRLPSTDAGLPARLTVRDPVARASTSTVPLRVTGTVRLIGTTGSVTGPGTAGAPDGATIAGTLSSTAGTVTIDIEVARAGRLALDLTVTPVLDARVLSPPRGLATWAAWARSSPPQAERQAALDLLVSTAATGARAASYSPYLGADLPGTGTTTFRYRLADGHAVATAARLLHPKPGPIALAALAGLLLAANAGLLWRRC